MFFPAVAVSQTYPLVSIHDLQFVDDQNLATGMDSSLTYIGDTVQVEGIVIFDPCAYGQSTTGSRVGTYIAAVNDSGAWSGIHILADPAVIGAGSGPAAVAQLVADAQLGNNWITGNTIKVTGILSSFSNNTQLNILPIPSSVTSISNLPPAPHIITIDSFELNDGQGGQTIQIVSGEKYEGVYVEMQNVRVVDVTVIGGGTRINWTIQDNFGNKMKVRDMSGWIRNDTADNFCTSSGSFTTAVFDTPVVNSVLAYVKGIVLEYKTGTGPYEYWIAPLTLSDIGPITYSAPTITATSLSNPVPSTTQTQTVTATITDFDGSVASAIIFYASGLSTNTFFTVPMTNISGNLYQATIPAIGPDSTYVKYWIKAIDNQGYYTNSPDSLGTNSFYLVKNSGITSIQQLQWHPLGFGASPYSGKTISNMDVNGIVMCESGSLYDLGQVMIQSSNNIWCGIALTGTGLTGLKRGDAIKITKAKVFESNTVTTLDSITFTVTSIGNALPSAIMNINMDSIIAIKFNYTEPYESMLLGFDTVIVVSLNPDFPGDFGEWAIYTNPFPVGQLRCDDQSNDIGFGFNSDSLILNQSLDYIYGMFTRAFSNWKLWPRNRDDIAGFQVIFIGVPKIINSADAWKIFPNPVTNEINIQNTGAMENFHVELFDAVGRNVLQQKTDSNNALINCESLSAGTYIIKIHNEHSTQYAKIVKLK